MNEIVNALSLRTGRAARLVCLAPMIACGASKTADIILPVVVPVKSVSVAPPTLTLVVGANQQLVPTPKDSVGGPLTGRTVTYTTSAPAVATVSGTGLVTAVAVGASNVVVSSEGQGFVVPVTVSATPVAQVAVVPASVSIMAGTTQQLTVTTRDAGANVLTGRVVTFATNAPAVATVSLTGLITGVTAGAANITVSSEGINTPVPVTINPILAGTTTADPAALPNASGQIKNAVAYNALNIPAMAAGGSYIDPITGVKVWKVTSATVPVANTFTTHWYSDGPSQISREYSNKHTLWVQSTGGTIYFADFSRSGGLTNYRAAPAGTLMATFAKDPATPSIVYLAMSNNTLRRYDVATSAFADVAPFPATFNGNQWLANDMTDVHFIAIANGSTTDVIHYDRSTNTKTSKTFVGLDEPYLDKNGRYVMANTSLTTVSIWDLSNDGVTSLTAPGQAIFAHTGAARGYFLTSDVNTGSGKTPFWAVDPAAARAHSLISNLGGYYPDSHHSGQWVQSDFELGGNLKKQWVLRETYDFSFVGNGASGVAEGIALLTIDGLNFKLVAHHYSVKPPALAGPNFFYYSEPRTTISIDGKLIMFDSNMNNSTRVDVFLIEVPIR